MEGTKGTTTVLYVYLLEKACVILNRTLAFGNSAWQHVSICVNVLGFSVFSQSPVLSSAYTPSHLGLFVWNFSL
jgi:hypothetical protein